MKRSPLIVLKTLTWVACLWPFALLVYGAVTNNLGPDPTANIAFTTGYTTLLLLIISLAVTPVRKPAALRKKSRAIPNPDNWVIV